MLFMMSLLHLSCDREEDDSQSTIIGKWEGTYQTSNSGEVSTHQVSIVFRNDGVFELTNKDAKIESTGQYESFLSLKKVTLFFNNDGDSKLSLMGSRNFIFILSGDELELSDTVNVFSLKRVITNEVSGTLGSWKCSDQDEGVWKLFFKTKNTFELYFIQAGVNSLALAGYSEWNDDRSEAKLTVTIGKPYKTIDAWDLSMDDDGMNIEMASSDNQVILNCKK